MDNPIIERPMLFAADMSRQVRAGVKTVTRRVSGLKVINDEPDQWRYKGFSVEAGKHIFSNRKNNIRELIRCPYGIPGERIWGKEGHYLYGKWDWSGTTKKTGKPKMVFQRKLGIDVRYPDDGLHNELKTYGDMGYGWYKRSPLFMSRNDSRILVENTGVYAQRVHDISEEDAIREGFENRQAFTAWWDEHRPGSWDRNDWVFVINFKEVM